MDLERSALGTTSAVFNAQSGSIVTADALGLAIIDRVVAGDARDQVADTLIQALELSDEDARVALPAIVADLLDHWDAAGLFDETRPDFPDPVFDHGHGVPNAVTYQTPYGKISVASQSRLLTQQLDEILGVLSDRHAEEGGDELKLRCVACAGGGYGVFDENPLWGRATLDEARFIVIREAAEILCGRDRVGAVLHGSAIAHGDHAVLVMGDTGRGKSTLAQGLVAAGCGFVSDDHLPLHKNGTDVLCFPTRSAVKPKALKLTEVKQLIRKHGKRSQARDGVTYLELPPFAEVGAKIPVGALIFPEYQEGAGLEITEITPEEAFEECILAGARPARTDPRIGPMATLCREIPAFGIRFGDSRQSIPACLELFEECKF
ncbi:MAG: hypothetical protein AAFQ79_13790 [Pseudomonadota bacterium]